MWEVQRSAATLIGLGELFAAESQTQDADFVGEELSPDASRNEVATGAGADPAEPSIAPLLAVAERLCFDIARILRAGLEAGTQNFDSRALTGAQMPAVSAGAPSNAAETYAAQTGGTLAPTTDAKRTDDNPNEILSRLRPAGASDQTARQDGLPKRGIHGVAASRAMAETDRARVMRFRERFEEAGRRYGLPPALLAAIASRESRGGAALDRNGEGDHGHGFGIMQVDNRNPFRVVREGGPFGQQHIDQAASILRQKLDTVRRQYPNMSPEEQLQTAVSRYNGGAGRPFPDSDRGTTGGDYANDVLARAQYYAERGDWRGGQIQAPTETQRGDRYTPAPSLADVRAGRAVLRRGEEGEAVRHVQRLLHVAADGKLGPQTERAVRDYQSAHDLQVDGVVGRRTLASLEGSHATEGTQGARGSGTVDYQGHHVSDPAVRAKLQQIADFFGRRVIVTSGDRDHIVNGNTRSHHLRGRAADFHVEGLSLGETYRRLKASGILARDYQVIYHTEVTVAPHIHIGHWGDNRRSDFIVDTGQILPHR